MKNGIMGNSSMPNYVKLTATAILASTYVAALLVAVDTYVVSGPQAQIPAVVAFVLGTGLSLALNVLGMHQGASLVETPAPGQPSGPVVEGSIVKNGGDNASA